jgi:hypothetical protein
METSEFVAASPYLVLTAGRLARVACSNVFNSTPVTAEVGCVAQEYRAGALADHGHSILCRFRH